MQVDFDAMAKAQEDDPELKALQDSSRLFNLLSAVVDGATPYDYRESPPLCARRFSTFCLSRLTFTLSSRNTSYATAYL
jgi:hypothetical protein